MKTSGWLARVLARFANEDGGRIRSAFRFTLS